jgi:hypothetical protein
LLDKGEQVMTAKMAALVALGALAATNASAQSVGTQHWVDDLSGVYRCVQRCVGGHLIHLGQTGWSLEVTNEAGQSSQAWIQRPGHIWTSWNDAAVYSADGFTIQFNSGTIWVLVEPMKRVPTLGPL